MINWTALKFIKYCFKRYKTNSQATEQKKKSEIHIYKLFDKNVCKGPMDKAKGA